MPNFNAIDSDYPFVTADYSNNSVTYGKMQQVSSKKILGNPTSSTANVSEIALSSSAVISPTAILNLFPDYISYTYFGGV